MIPISYEMIREAVEGEYRGTLSGPVTSVVIDSRQVTEGALFVAVKGEKVDAHRFIPNAYAAGAVCVFASREYASANEIEVPEGRLLVITEDPVYAMGRLAKAYRHLFHIPVIAVTGSVGKTTAKEMLAAALSAGLCVHKTPGNLNSQFGLPLSVFGLEREHQVAVLEMGMNHFGEIRYLADIAEPDIGVITNIGVSHIEFLGSQRGILKAKTELLEQMDEHNHMFFNGDDPLLREYAQTCRIPHTLYGFEEGADIRCVDYKQNGKILQAEIIADGHTVLLEAQALGKHLVNAMMIGFGIGRYLGLSDEVIRKGLLSFAPTSRRMNVHETEHYLILDDSYNASPASCKAAIDVAEGQKKQTGRRLVAVLGDMFEMGFYAARAHREVGAYVAENGVDKLIAVGAFSAEMADEATKVAADLGKDLEVVYYPNLDELKKNLFSELRDDDIILVKASNGMAFGSLIPMLIGE